MSLPAEGGSNLAAQQAALVAALLAGDEVPAGFDAERLRVAGRALERKRLRAVARAWPVLASALGARFAELFFSYAQVNPLPRQGGPLADGRFFVRWLLAREELPEAARLQALSIDLRYRTTANGLIPRRGPALCATWLRQPRRLVVAVRLPWLGEHWLHIWLGRARRQPSPSSPTTADSSTSAAATPS
jgi:hypothetical protein